MENKTYFNKLRSLTKKTIQLEHHASNLKSYIDNNTVPKGLNIKLTPQTPGVKFTRFMKRWDDILFNCSFRLLQLLLSFSIYGYKQINLEINETFIKTPLSVTPEDMEISLEGNFQIDTIRSSKQHIIFNNNKKKNYFTFHIVSDQHEPPIGDVIIFRTTKTIVEQSVVDTLQNKPKSRFCHDLCNNAVEVAISRNVVVENGIEELSIESKPEFKTAMFEIWRPSRPNETLVFNLVKALTIIDKDNEADAVQEGFADYVEFKPVVLQTI
ncbi:unnamed protein product [Mytilus coruscus]|uniref:Uncharacterized protein n=1 Tax=Mytilus coruscus TaxID=42192 RepID=A0A6J8EXS6_MYTCO|nr:unnamed protein product [Mytilus coruscus]